MTEPTVLSFSASSSLIFRLNSFSSDIKVSSTSSESRPRSSEKDALSTIADCSTPNFSWMIVFTLSAIVGFLLITEFIIYIFDFQVRPSDSACHWQDQSGLMQRYYNAGGVLLLFLPLEML